MATKTCPCIVSYKTTGNRREMCGWPIGVAGFCIASFLKLQSGNKHSKLPENQIWPKQKQYRVNKKTPGVRKATTF